MMGALPRRFRRQRVLVVGCGDVGLRAVRHLVAHAQVIALTSSPHKVADLRAVGCVPLQGNLDEPTTLRRLSGLGQRVLHLAPPPQVHGSGWAVDARTRSLVQVLSRRSPPSVVVYGSTSGVYGDCEGARIDETQPLRAETPRAARRVDAEAAVRSLRRRAGVAWVVLRIPGIYAPDREGGTPRPRLEKGLPVLRHEDDVFTNHIHADDLARACVLALWRGGRYRAVHVSDDTELRMGDYYDLAADLYGLPRPPRLAKAGAQAELPLSMLSFMNESRRLDNTRLKTELGLKLRYSHVRDGLLAPGSATSDQPA